MHNPFIQNRCPYAPIYIVSPAGTDASGSPVILASLENDHLQMIQCVPASSKSDKFFAFASGLLLGVMLTCLALALMQQVNL